ncbi:hypothetical protein TWF696_002552 [Orbilia brochopaga]|uniref:F-box domain-containing protein n=1 Tax=Orbilia brochopaga TaxID=3140254 RepID=A0AAV9U5Y3_9PEZI
MPLLTRSKRRENELSSRQNSDRISLSRDVPLDIKLCILESIETVDSLTSLMLTCHAFYDISQTHLWNSILKRTLERDVDPVGRTLVKLLRFKAGKTVEELATALPTKKDDDHETAPGYLDDLMSTRRTVRFFTKLFFEEMFYEQLTGPWGDIEVTKAEIAALMPTISKSEYARVEKAYYILWLFLELNLDGYVQSLGQTTTHCEIMNKWTIWNEDCSARFEVDLGLLYVVHNITDHRLICRYRDSCRRRMKRRTMTGKERHPYDICPATPLPVSPLEYLGFKKFEALLRTPLEERRAIVLGLTECNWHHPNIEGQNGWVVNGTRLQYFVLESWWMHMMHSSHMDRRRLWRAPNRIYRPEVLPWHQDEDHVYFNLMAMMWDNERLAAWGYFRPGNIINPERLDQLR